MSDGELLSECHDNPVWGGGGGEISEVQSNHNRSHKPQQSPPPYDHRAVRFIWKEAPILITVMI